MAAGELVAVGITGKPFIFGVGADLKDVGTLTSREQALAVARLGHDQLRRLGELAVPSFAFVNGAAMGGGVEVALHCTYRTISSSVPAVALPECFLGLVPGWGGTYLLPRLIGPAGALEVIVSNALNQNRMLTGAQAFTLGHRRRDVRAGRLPRAVAALGGVRRRAAPPWWSGTTTPPTRTRGRPPSPARGASRRPRPTAPHPRRTERSTWSRAAAPPTATPGSPPRTTRSPTSIMSDEFRSGIYAFDLVQRRAKRPVGAPDKALARPVTKVGIVGAGLMASPARPAVRSPARACRS